ncbi:MAG TPA: type 4a pilus biogenesis protein PilO [Candidatus Limnocylindrales bacterium]|nr:type 4a pilus biogenesis protein PilO [Candidatus Limnocylindrales bacterium]
MAQGNASLKRIGLNQTNARIVLVTAAAAFLVMFFLVASYALFGQLRYQNKVIGVKKTAVKQLKMNLEARDSLVRSYEAFVSTPQNLIGGQPSGGGPQDGSNAKLVLDALPSKYDFPALTTSLEQLALEEQLRIQSITGTDDEVTQGSAQASGTPAPVEMPFEFSVAGDYNKVQSLIAKLEQSIRPIQVQTTKISGDQNDLTLTVNAKTFYQPEKTLNIATKVVK